MNTEIVQVSPHRWHSLCVAATVVSHAIILSGVIIAESLKLVKNLTGEKYLIWAVRMKTYLVSNDLWNVTDPEANAADLVASTMS